MTDTTPSAKATPRTNTPSAEATPSEDLTLRVAAAQLLAGPDSAANLSAAAEQVRRAAEAGAALIVFPEATQACFGTDLRSVAQPVDGPFASGLAGVAAECEITVVAGMFEPAPDGRVFNTLVVTDGGSAPLAVYRKIHLYDAFGARESDLVAPGSDLVTLDVAGIRVGLATCYDLRFADQFTALGRAGAQLVCVPASWGEGPGKAEQWDLLVRARAMDAQAWLLACDQAWTAPRGTDPLGIGRSALVDPVGTVRARLGSDAGLLVHEVNTAAVAATRVRIPIL